MSVGSPGKCRDRLKAVLKVVLLERMDEPVRDANHYVEAAINYGRAVAMGSARWHDRLRELVRALMVRLGYAGGSNLDLEPELWLNCGRTMVSDRVRPVFHPPLIPL